MQATLYLNVPLSAIAPGRTADAKFLPGYMKKLNRKQAIAICAKLNLYTSALPVKGPIEMHQEQLGCLERMRHDGIMNEGLCGRLLTQFQRMLETNGSYPLLFARSGLLEMIRWLGLHGSDEVCANALTSREHLHQTFMEALLTCGEVFLARYHKHFSATLEPKTLHGKELEERRRQIQPVMRLMMEHSPPIRDPRLSIGRARLLLMGEFFHKNSQYIDEFERRHHGLSVDDYLVCATTVMLLTLKFLQEGTPGILNGMDLNTAIAFSNSEDLREPFRKFLEFKSQTSSQLATAFTKQDGTEDFLNLKPMREKPILCEPDGQAVVLDINLLADSISVGPLFMLLDGKKTHDNAVFSAFGDACHRYAFDLVDKCDSSLDVQNRAKALVYEPQCKHIELSQQLRSLTDIAVIDEHEAALIETKGRWFNEKALKSDHVAFWDEINRLYGISVEGSEQKRKGYVQLADALKLLCTDKAVAIGSASSIRSVKSFYPVLLVHDELMHQPNLPHLLALDFVRQFEIDELPERGMFSFGKYEVHSLILISLNELEALQSQVLEKSLNAYFAEYSDWSPLRSESLVEFLQRQHSELKSRPAEEQLVRKSAMDALNNLAVRAFGKELPR